MKEELPANHLLLSAMLFDLLDAVIKSSPADELRGNTLPISMLPLFFTVQVSYEDVRIYIIIAKYSKSSILDSIFFVNVTI